MRRFAALLALVTLTLAGGTGYYAGSSHLLTPQSAFAADECQTFPQTGKQVCGRFLEYWRANGGLAQQGLPLSDPFDERSDVNGQTYKVQYFERAVFEAHPENQRPYDVLLSLVGREKLQAKYPAGLPTGAAPLQAGQVVVLPGGSYSKTTTFRVTITDIQQVTSIPASGCCAKGATAKGRFIVVLMQVTNLGQESDALGSFRLRDQQGRTFDSTSDFEATYSAQAAYKRKSYSESVQPSLSEDELIVFDVASDATSFTIIPRTR